MFTGPPTLRSRTAPTQSCTLSIDARRPGCLARPPAQVRSFEPRARMTRPAHHGVRPFFLSALRAAGRATTATLSSWMAFTADKQGHDAALLAARRHGEQPAARIMALVERRILAAALGGAELRAPVACMALVAYGRQLQAHPVSCGWQPFLRLPASSSSGRSRSQQRRHV